MQLDPPRPIPDFLDDLAAAGHRIVPGSLIWIPDPHHPGREIAAVRVEDGAGDPGEVK